MSVYTYILIESSFRRPAERKKETVSNSFSLLLLGWVGNGGTRNCMAFVIAESAAQSKDVPHDEL